MSETIHVRLCDDDGMVSDQAVESGSPGTIAEPHLTYLGLLNNLRRHTGLPPVHDQFPCTGAAHLAAEEFRCTSPAHRSDADIMRSLTSRAEAYDDALKALIEVGRQGPLSTTIGYLIRAGFLVLADPPPTISGIRRNWPVPGDR